MFKNFYLKDIFGDEPIRGTRLTKKNRISGNIPLVTAGEQNEGIAEYISNSENQTLSNMLTIDMFGNCFYRDYLYKSDDNILSFGLNGKSTEEMLYIASTINSICKKQYSYVRQYRKGSYLETTIPLPVVESSDPNHEYTVDDIDWQYMQERIAELERKRIAELEQERIAELDAYLVASGLDDYELTDEDKNILSLFPASASDEAGASETNPRNGQVRFKKFKVGELFDIHPTAAYKMKNNELFASVGTTPVLSNSFADNGIGGYCGLAPTEQGGMITFSDTTTGADTMFYQPNPFIGYPHVQGMYPYQPDKWNEKCCLYVISCIRKSAGNDWNYAVKFNRALVKELSIELPVVESPDLDHKYTVDDIDFDYMEWYIRATEKLAIADVVKYKDKLIETTRQIVGA